MLTLRSLSLHQVLMAQGANNRQPHKVTHAPQELLRARRTFADLRAEHHNEEDGHAHRSAKERFLKPFKNLARRVTKKAHISPPAQPIPQIRGGGVVEPLPSVPQATPGSGLATRHSADSVRPRGHSDYLPAVPAPWSLIPADLLAIGAPSPRTAKACERSNNL